MIDSLFFELLQVAIGTRKSLSRTPSADEWKEIFALSKKQALVGIAFAGVTRLNTASDYGASLGIPEIVYLNWLGLVAKTQQRNHEINAECIRLVKQLQHDRFHCCILKGQSNQVNYPEHLRDCRTAGDIDVLFRSMEQPDVLDIPIRYCQKQARLLGEKPPHVTYHHADLAWEGVTEVEGHYRATFLCSPLRNWRLQHWLEDNMPFGVCDFASEFAQQGQTPLCKKSVGELVESIPIPTVSFNAIYQLLHIYKHLFEEGIGLRQLLDYYFVMKAFEDSKQSTKEEIMHILSRFGMKKFTSATMYVLQTVFAMPDEYLICPPNEKEGQFLLNEIMQAGNFGKYDDRIKHGGSQFSHAIEKTKHNLRLFTHYPEEVICEPFFRVYHWMWRKLELWKTL